MLSVDENVKELEFTYTDGENVQWYNHFGKMADPAIPFLNFYPRVKIAYVQRIHNINVHSSLFVIAKHWE